MVVAEGPVDLMATKTAIHQLECYVCHAMAKTKARSWRRALRKWERRGWMAFEVVNDDGSLTDKHISMCPRCAAKRNEYVKHYGSERDFFAQIQLEKECGLKPLRVNEAFIMFTCIRCGREKKFRGKERTAGMDHKLFKLGWLPAVDCEGKVHPVCSTCIEFIVSDPAASSEYGILEVA